MLDWYRATLLSKAGGLTDDQAREAAVAPSDLNLLGLIRHLTEVEREWFRIDFRGEVLPPLYYNQSSPTGDPDGDFHPGAQDSLADGIAALTAAIEESRAIVAASSLDDLDKRGGTVNLRWTLLHLIEEYARHCGHADLIRQRIDGTVGE